MKIIKETSGVTKITKDKGDFITAIPGGQYVHLHPRAADTIFISESSNSQDNVNRIVIKASEVTEAFGNAFSRDRLALATLLSANF